MSAEEVLYRSPMLHRLLRDTDGSLVLEVVVGGIAMDEVRVRLNADEAEAWTREGGPAIDRLAAAIVANPRFDGRSYRV